MVIFSYQKNLRRKLLSTYRSQEDEEEEEGKETLREKQRKRERERFSIKFLSSIFINPCIECDTRKKEERRQE